MKSMIWKFLPPGSKAEIFFRSFYHLFNSSRIISYFNRKRAERSYQVWKRIHIERIETHPVSHNDPPEVIFIFRIQPGQEQTGSNTLSSIINQSLRKWKIFILTNDFQSVSIENWIPQDNRIQVVSELASISRNKTISKDTAYFLFCDVGDVFSKHFIKLFSSIYESKPQADVYSTDVEVISEKDQSRRPFFKPSTISPEFLLSTNYLTRSLIHAKYIGEVTSFNLMDLFEQEWDLLLQILKDKSTLIHIPYLLLSTIDQSFHFLDEIQNRMFIKHSGSSFIDVDAISNGYGKNLDLQEKVSIIIPTIDNFQKIFKLVNSIISLTNYENYELIIVDTGSTDPKVLDYFTEIQFRSNVKIINDHGEFNYSRVLNQGAKSSAGEFLVFLNNDMEVVHKDWLIELARWVAIPSVGIVGTRLLFPDYRIQHAGVIIGLQGFAGNLYKNFPQNYFGFTGSLNWTRNLTAVTGACHMIRRDVFMELGGYDEKFRLVFSDIALCLKAIEKGYRVVYAPRAEMIHYEGKSRGFQTPVDDMALGYKLMESYHQNGDPLFSSQLTYSTIPLCNTDPDPNTARLKRIAVRKKAIEMHRFS